MTSVSLGLALASEKNSAVLKNYNLEEHTEMKKVLAFLLALSMCLVFVTGCTKISDDDPAAKGAEFDVYFGKKVMTLDPAIAYTDDNAVKIINLVFEGLFRLDENGKLKKALAKKYEILEDPKTGEDYLEITINDTYWSDGSVVQANDVVYAWRRILNPDFDSPAASMLYCIKGAKDAKNGDASVYDIGLYAVKANRFRVFFEEGANIDEFLYNLASPALVPVRENKVASYPDTWCTGATDLSTNGPFRVKKYSADDPTEHITLERSKYYYLNQEVETEAKDKFVTPFRINIRYDVPLDRSMVVPSDTLVNVAESDVISMFNNKELFYVSGLTAATASAYGKNVKIEEEASAFTFYFNFAKDFAQETAIRKAFSMALDRNAIAATLGLGTTAATGILNGKVYNTKKGTSFRKSGGDVISASANIDAARAILEEAGIDPADYDDIYVLIRGDEMGDNYDSEVNGYMSNEKAILYAAVEAWNALGFTVEVDICNYHDFDENGVDNGFIAKYESGDYDIVGMDYQMISTYALYDLAMFSYKYSAGAALLAGRKTVTGVTTSTPYTIEAFDNLLDEAFKEADLGKRAEILHNAEKVLVDEEAAVIPVVFNTNAYVVSKELSKVKTDYWGVQIFKKAQLKNYVQYLPSVRAAANAGDETEE
jgi:oligopeptide transport system substrate-binding protein